MSGTIWLICESKKDFHIVEAILKKRYPQVTVEPLFPRGGKSNLSRLTHQLERLIKDALEHHETGDCIVVLHDLDIQTRPHDRADYQRIEQICTNHRRYVTRIEAMDEIEAWLLADTGFCEWLTNTRPQNWDERKKPSVTLDTLLNEAKKPKFTIENMPKILLALDGTGDKHSPSLRKALEHLKDAPCTRS